MSKLCRLLILKYCQNRTLFNLLKSRSILTREILEKIRDLTLINYRIGKYCRENDQFRLAYLLYHYINNPWLIDYNDGLMEACLGGHQEIVNLMITKGATKGVLALNYACLYNNRNIVDLMITHSRLLIDYNWALSGACLGGHRELVDLMISKGATKWNWGLYYACFGGHLEIVVLMINQGATEFTMGLQQACRGGHQEIIDLMIIKGATDWNCGLNGACMGHQQEFVNLMIDKGATSCYTCQKTIEQHLQDN